MCSPALAETGLWGHLTGRALRLEVVQAKVLHWPRLADRGLWGATGPFLRGSEQALHMSGALRRRDIKPNVLGSILTSGLVVKRLYPQQGKVRGVPAPEDRHWTKVSGSILSMNNSFSSSHHACVPLRHSGYVRPRHGQTFAAEVLGSGPRVSWLCGAGSGLDMQGAAHRA